MTVAGDRVPNSCATLIFVDVTTKWMTHPKDSAAQFFLPFVFIVGGVAFLTAFFHGLAGEDPVGPVTWFLSASWEAVSPLTLFLVALWGFHLVSYLLVGSFARDMLVIAGAAKRIAFAFWYRFFSSWIGPAFPVDILASLSLVRPFRLSLPLWLATGWRAGDSVQLE